MIAFEPMLAVDGLNVLFETPEPLNVPPLTLAVSVLAGSLWHIEADELVIVELGEALTVMFCVAVPVHPFCVMV